MSCGPRTTEEKIISGAGAVPKGGYMDGTSGGSPPPDRAHMGELALAVVGPYWVLSALGALRH